MGFAAIGASTLALAVADRGWRDMEVLTSRASRDNCAEEAMMLSDFWFKRLVRGKDAESLKSLFSAQVLEVPNSVLAPLREAQTAADVYASVLDQDYDTAFEKQAADLDLPRGRRSTVTIPSADAGQGQEYVALRFELRVIVRDRSKGKREHLLRRGVVVLYDASGRFYGCFDSYMKRKYGRNM